MMRFAVWFIVLVAIGSVAGCGNAPPPKESKGAGAVQAALAKLSAEDRRLAETQKYCAVQPKQALGSMGTPIKIMLDGEAVFLCCDHCEEAAKKDQAATLKKVKDLRAASR